MTSRPIEWSEIARLFHMLSVVFRDEGRTALPSYDSKPSPAVDAECDVFCRQLACNLIDPPLPPPSIRGWILARAIGVSALAGQLATQKESSPGPLTRTLAERLLIDEWHGALWALWPKLADDSRAFSF
jgi:hypothetical protein